MRELAAVGTLGHLTRMQEHAERVGRAVAEREALLKELEIILQHAADNLALLPVDKHTARVRSNLIQSMRLVTNLRRVGDNG